MITLNGCQHMLTSSLLRDISRLIHGWISRFSQAEVKYGTLVQYRQWTKLSVVSKRFLMLGNFRTVINFLMTELTILTNQRISLSTQPLHHMRFVSFYFEPFT